MLGGAAFNIWHGPMIWCLLLVVFVATAIGFLNGVFVGIKSAAIIAN
jgi:hypothetical protein